MTFEDIEQAIIPRLGVSYRELLLSEIIIAYNGIQKDKQQDYEFYNKVIHNAARFQAFFSVRSNPFIKHAPKRFSDIYEFEWEKGQNGERPGKPTDEQWAEWTKIFPDKL